MKTCMVFLMVGVIMSAYGSEKKATDKRPAPLDIAVANAKPQEKPKSPSDTTEAPKTEDGQRQSISSHTTTKIEWSLVKKHQGKA